MFDLATKESDPSTIVRVEFGFDGLMKNCQQGESIFPDDGVFVLTYDTWGFRGLYW